MLLRNSSVARLRGAGDVRLMGDYRASSCCQASGCCSASFSRKETRHACCAPCCSVCCPPAPVRGLGKLPAVGNIPQVGPARNAPQGALYLVYRVYPVDNSDTWKWGITRVFSFSEAGALSSNRPTVGITGCQNYFDQTCIWSVDSFHLGYLGARAVERTRIIDYAILNNHCPPGQPSCK